MRSYLIRRVILAAVSVLMVTTLVFFLIHLLPGDPIDMVLGERALGADREVLRRQWGLDLPVWRQYLAYLGGLGRGELGISMITGEGVGGLLASRYPATLVLAGLAMAMALVLAVPAGLMAASRAGRPADGLATLGAVMGAALPTFLVGPLLILLFSVWLGWLPVSGWEEWDGILLPAATLALPMAALLTRLIRRSALNTLGEDFVRSARAKGVPPWKVMIRHVLRPAANPVISVVGLQWGALLTGSIVTEKIFAWPGVGSLLVWSLQSRDYPVLQGCLIAVGLTYVAVNLATDLGYAIDPRVRLDQDGGAS